MKCYICEKNEANSNEHIIPNAIGGVLRAKILCKDCNSKLGASSDAVLAEQCLLFSNFVNHTRDRKDIPDLPCQIIDDGNAISVKRSAKTKDLKGIVRHFSNNRDSVNCSFKVYGKDAKNILKKEVKNTIVSLGTKKNWPSEKVLCTIDEITDKIDNTKEQEIKTPLMLNKLSFGGKESFLSLLKTAINFYIMNDGDKKYISEALRILKDSSNDVSHIVRLYYPDNFTPEDSIYHTLYVKGDKCEKKLICLISYYNVYQVIVLLNNDYTGDNIEFNYCYDIWNEKIYRWNGHLNVASVPFKDIFSNTDTYLRSCQTKMKENFGSFIKHFVVPKVIPNETTNNFANDIMKAIKDIAVQPNFMDKKSFITLLNDKIISLRRSPKLAFVKDKNLVDCVKSNEDGFYGEYLYYRAWFIVCADISNYVAHLITHILIKNTMKTELSDFDNIKNNVISYIINKKYNDDRIDKFLPRIQEEIPAMVDFMVEGLKNDFKL